MSTHILAVGPNRIRQLCCSAAVADDDEMVRAAFDSIDDPVALIDLRPVTVDLLWHSVLASCACDSSERTIVVHPSWWASARIDLVSAAAQIIAGEVVLLPRSWLLIKASPLKSQHATVVVEIADCLVVITGATVVAESRCGEQERVAGAVARSVRRMISPGTAAVVIDAPNTVAGAGALAAMIADRLLIGDRISAVHVDNARLRLLAAQVIQEEDSTREPRSDEAASPAHRRHRGPVVVAVVLVAAALGALATGGHRAPVGDGIPTTTLVEGRVALEIPAQWPMQRVVAGPGSARVQVTSPSDPELALHVTQSRVAIATLSATAESLKLAIDAEPTGVFVDFNPAGSVAGRSAVTYREVRPGHDIEWIVLVDKAVRISIGCQSRHGRDDAVRQVCDRAVRSARTVS